MKHLNIFFNHAQKWRTALATTKPFMLTLLMAVILLCGTAFNASAQTPTMTPGINPNVIRFQDATFTVVINNVNTVSFSDLILEASVPSGFTITPPMVTGINLAANNGTDTVNFTVTADCTAPQSGAVITYTLKSDASTTLTTAGTPTISIAEPEFIFTPPADFLASHISTTKTYTRVWSITQTTNNAATNVRVMATCNKANLEITKVELVADAAGTVVLSDLTATAFDNTLATSYIYNIGADVLSLIGDLDPLFENYETVYIRETYKLLTCDNAPATYTYSHGNGTDFCPFTHSFITSAKVASPNYIPDIETGINTKEAQGATSKPNILVFPTSANDTGKIYFTIRNNSLDTNAILFETKVAVYLGGSIDVGSTQPTYECLRAYLVDASGVPLSGFPSLSMVKNTTLGDISADPYRWVISFENLDNTSQATAYEALGFSDITGNGKWNDLLPGMEVYICMEWQYKPNEPTLPNECLSGNVNFQNSHTRRADLCYINNCGVNQRYHRGYTTSGTSTDHYMGVLRYNAPSNIIITPENIKAKDTVEMRINEKPVPGGDNSGWLVDQNIYDQYIIVTLPEGFDYDDTQQGFRINNFALCATADVIKSYDSNGRVVLTVHNRQSPANSSNQYYRISMIAKNDIDPDADRSIDIQHGWNWKDEPVSTMIKYGCHIDQPINYKLIVSYQNMSLYNFQVQRMTFGWNNYLMTERINLTNIDSYPDVNRDVAGPFDNVDMTGKIAIESGFTIAPTESWLVDVTYTSSAYSYYTPTNNPYFYFPNPAQAVEVSLNGGAPFYIPETDLAFPTTSLAGNNLQRTIRIDLTDYTLSGQPLEALTDSDTLTITLKTQTLEKLPRTMVLIPDFTMQTWLEEGSGAPENKNILTKNFFVVNYARNTQATFSSAGIFYENDSENIWSGGARLYTSIEMATSEVFTGEFRPNQIQTYATWTYNTLVDIVEVITREYFLGEAITTRIDTLKTGYTIDQSNGATTVTVTKNLYMERIVGDMLYTQSRGIYYCIPDVLSAPMEAHYIFYPTAEKQVDTIIKGSPIHFAGGKYEYTHQLSAVSPDIIPLTTTASWNFNLANQSYWAATDGLLPHSWMAVTLPPEIEPSSLVLTDGDTITKPFSEFYNYAPGKYWVQLGDLDITTNKQFTLSATYTSCQKFDVEVHYSMSRGGYPLDPDRGFDNGSGSFCRPISTLKLSATPSLFELRGLVVSPVPNGDIVPERYLFCEPHEFKAVFNNVQTGVLENPVLRVRLGVGISLDSLSVTAVQNTAIPTDLTTAIVITGDDGDIETERYALISLPGVFLQPYNTEGDEIAITFELKPECGFMSGSTVDMTFSAKDACGDTKSESHSSVPIYIDGDPIESAYLITDFDITGTIDLGNATATAGSYIDVTGTITLSSTNQQENEEDEIVDYIAISVPPNMTIFDNGGTGFTFKKVDAGNNLYYAQMPALTTGVPYVIDVRLTPTNPGNWSCDDVTVGIYTSVLFDVECGGIECQLEEKHEGSSLSTTVSVAKEEVTFSSIVATGSFYSTTEEKISFSGRLNVEGDTDFENVTMKLYSNRTGSLQPISGVSAMTLPLTRVEGTDPEYFFSSGTATIVVPAVDVCHLWLVAHRADNPYFCDDASIRIMDVGFIMTPDSAIGCAETDILIGDALPITGYNYTWSPATYIQGDAHGTPVTVHYPASLSGNNQTTTVQIQRGSCNAAASVVVTIKPTATSSSISAVDGLFCSLGEITLTASTTIANPTFNWYTSQTSTSSIWTGPSLSVAPFEVIGNAVDTTFYVSVFSDDICENNINNRKAVTATVLSIPVLTINVPQNYLCGSENVFFELDPQLGEGFDYSIEVPYAWSWYDFNTNTFLGATEATAAGSGQFTPNWGAQATVATMAKAYYPGSADWATDSARIQLTISAFCGDVSGTVTLYMNAGDPDADMEIVEQPTGTQDICEDNFYTVKITETGKGGLANMAVTFEDHIHTLIAVDNAEYLYPASDRLDTISASEWKPMNALERVDEWNYRATFPDLDSVTLVNGDSILVRFNVHTDCGFFAGGNYLISFIAQDVCLSATTSMDPVYVETDYFNIDWGVSLAEYYIESEFDHTLVYNEAGGATTSRTVTWSVAYTLQSGTPDLDNEFIYFNVPTGMALVSITQAEAPASCTNLMDYNATATPDFLKLIADGGLETGYADPTTREYRLPLCEAMASLSTTDTIKFDITFEMTDSIECGPYWFYIEILYADTLYCGVDPCEVLETRAGSYPELDVQLYQFAPVYSTTYGSTITLNSGVFELTGTHGVRTETDLFEGEEFDVSMIVDLNNNGILDSAERVNPAATMLTFEYPTSTVNAGDLFDFSIATATPFDCGKSLFLLATGDNLCEDIIIPLATICGTTSVCKGDTAEYRAPSGMGASYLFTYPATQMERIPLQGNIAVNATDSIARFVLHTAGTFNISVQYILSGTIDYLSPATIAVVVNGLPEITIEPVEDLCLNASPVTLEATPAGGTFKGNGVTGTTFDPALALVGSSKIYYTTAANANGCVNTDSITIVVKPLPEITFPTVSALCENAAAITLGATPTGGSYSGDGIDGNKFDPTVAGEGTHTITYTYTDPGTNCTNTKEIGIEVYDVQEVTLTLTNNSLCEGGDEITLAGGLPTSGVYYYDDAPVTGFDPTTAGKYGIKYVYTDANLCSSEATDTIVVNTLPVITFPTVNPLCENAAAITLGATPAGGSYSGDGIDGNKFDPAEAGEGVHTITYTYTNPGTNCTNSKDIEIVVNPFPNVTLMLPNKSLCQGGAAITLTGGSPEGGTYYYNNTPVTNFNPTTVGKYGIKYVYSDDNQCSSEATDTIDVHAVPTAPIVVNSPLEACDDSGIVDLMDALGEGLIATNFVFYENADKTNPLPGHTYTYTDPVTVYVAAINDYSCESPVSSIDIIDCCPNVVTVYDPILAICSETNYTIDLTTLADPDEDGVLQFSKNKAFEPMILNPTAYVIAVNTTEVIYIRAYNTEEDCFSRIDSIEITVNLQPIAPVIIVRPFLADPGEEINLSTLVLINPNYTYRYYTDAALTDEVTGGIIIFDTLKTDYYVTASTAFCTSDPSEIMLKRRCPDFVRDAEGNAYNVTSLAGLCWTENLRTTIDPTSGLPIAFAKAYEYAGGPSQLDTIFGLLYTWYSAVGVPEGSKSDTVQGICPEGWRIPSQEDWSLLQQYPAQQLKSTKYWIDPQGPGDDRFGFNALPAGWYEGATERFVDLYGYAGWWASDDSGSGNTANHFRITYHCDQIENEVKAKRDALSVRCVLNFEYE